MIRLTDEQWERIRDHFPEETIIRSLIESRFSASVKGAFGQRNCKMRDNRISVGHNLWATIIAVRIGHCATRCRSPSSYSCRGRFLSHKQALFQVVDIVSTMAPLTKMARQIVSPATIPSIVREAFRLAQQERLGPVHLELPEDIAHEMAPDVPLVMPHPIEMPVAQDAA